MKKMTTISVAAAAYAMAGAGAAFAGCDVVPAVQQASQVASSVTAGLIAQRVNTAASASISTGGAGGAGGTVTTSSPSQTANVGPSSTVSSCTPAPEPEPTLNDDGNAASRQGADAARAKSGKINAVWLASSVTWLNKTDKNGNYGGSVSNAVVGYDRRLSENLIGGIALGYEKVLINTRYVANGGSVEGDTVSVAPYLGYVLADWLVLDASAGYARVMYRFKANATETGDSTANRFFGSTNLTAFERMGDTLFKASVGYLRIGEFQGSYTSSQATFNRASLANFGQLQGTLSAGHDFRTSQGIFTPNAFVRYEYDVPHSAKVDLADGYRSTTDRDGVVFGLGFDAALEDFKINLAATTTQFRTNTEMYGVAANVRYSF